MSIKKQSTISIANGDRIKVIIYDDLIVDHVLDVMAKAYAYQIRTGVDLSRPPNAELKEYLTKVQ